MKLIRTNCNKHLRNSQNERYSGMTINKATELLAAKGHTLVVGQPSAKGGWKAVYHIDGEPKSAKQVTAMAGK
tara:strand:+ start:175 stop:393 length:219 start_codon:yes stop_codon:yes gene_type:complete